MRLLLTTAPTDRPRRLGSKPNWEKEVAVYLLTSGTARVMGIDR